MSEWSSGAYDTKRDRLIIWGGGHAGYSGNEVYVFDIKTLKWQRLNEPSRDVGGDPATGYYPDGLPRSRHTYDHIEYVPNLDRFCSFGGAALYPAGPVEVPNVDCFDFETLKWERKADAPSYGIGALAAYDAATGYVWLHAAGNSGHLSRYDPKKDKWKIYGQYDTDGWIDYEMTGEVDPKRRLFVAVGHGHLLIKSLKRGFVPYKPLKISGADKIVKADSPGFVYVPRLDKFVAWSGGADVYLLDMEKRQWKRIPPAAGNKVLPPAAEETGTFGRFRYIPSKDAFIVVNRINENVFIYKLPPVR